LCVRAKDKVKRKQDNSISEVVRERFCVFYRLINVSFLERFLFRDSTSVPIEIAKTIMQGAEFTFFRFPQRKASMKKPKILSVFHDHHSTFLVFVAALFTSKVAVEPLIFLSFKPLYRFLFTFVSFFRFNS